MAEDKAQTIPIKDKAQIIPGFAGISIVHMADNTKRQINQIKKGDIVDTPLGPATVLCVVETPLIDQRIVKVSVKLYTTVGMPVLVRDEWYYAQNISTAVITDCSVKKVYNIVLNAHHVVIIGGVSCATLGNKHHNTGGLIERMQKTDGWQTGFIVARVGAAQPT